MKIKDYIKMDDIILPEFDHNKRIESQTALIYDGLQTYDIIWGWDFLHQTGVKLNFGLKTVTWMDKTIQMQNKNILNVFFMRKNVFVYI